MGGKKIRNQKYIGESPIYAVFQENGSIIKKFLRRFTSSPHDIEDITQETILRALQAEKNREVREPRAFLFGVARNIARKELEKKSRSIIDFIEDFSDQRYVSNEPEVEECVDSRERMVIFLEAVSTLPLQCQRVFVLKKVYGFSHNEIAKKLGISISTTEKHVAAGLKRCNKYMERGLNENDSADIFSATGKRPLKDLTG